MNHIDLFSGIGGFALAAHWAGYQTRLKSLGNSIVPQVAYEILKMIRFGESND